MDTKLTLRLDINTIREAKKYVLETNTSLSKLIENYLNTLIQAKKKTRKINPIVKSLTGIVKLEDKKNYKKAYANYLNEKYK